MTQQRKITRKRRDYSEMHGNKIQETFNKDNKENWKASFQDERFWVLSKDENGAGNAVIRFLPNKNEKELPFKITYKHSIYLNKKTFIDRCPTTIDQPCPICEWNKDQNSDVVKMKLKSYRKKHWIANILVISDPKNRENEGKVFLFEFGSQIHDILKETLQPEDEDDTPFYFYCPDDGANFKLKVKKDKEYPSWTRSSFMEPEPIDAVLDAFNLTDEDWMSQLYDLDEVVSTDAYKEYNDLKVKFIKYLSNANIDGIVTNSEFEATETESAKSYSRTKKEAESAIDEPEDEPEDEKPMQKPTSARTSSKIPDSKAKQKVVKNFFKQFEDGDGDSE